MENFETVKKRLLKDHEIKQEYDNLGSEFETIKRVIELRLSKHLSQKELAEKLGTKQSAVSRFEQGRISPTLSFLSKLAKSMDKKLVVSFK